MAGITAVGAGKASGLPEINQAELIRYFTLIDADEAFVRQFRTGRNVGTCNVQ